MTDKYASKYILNDEADVLEAAALEMEKRGWTVGHYEGGVSKKVCILGSVYAAVFNDPNIMAKEINFFSKLEKPITLAQRTIQLLHTATSNSTHGQGAVHWNDVVCKSEEEAIEKLRMVAKIFREKE